ncbi:cyclin-dependent kinase 4 inhibitor B-like [Pseudophryne corroboree]|uniref:cyclin-dependent kinase 4 inhibitor B-like n=1 Tax=Pseudophryne corroboree TaxID=495146 RepID=UPI003081E6A8
MQRWADRLSAAAALGDLGTAKMILENGTNPNAINSCGRTAIQVMMMGSPKMAQLLLAHSADPNMRDPRTGRTPAHDAASEGFLDTLVVLLKGNAHIHIPDIWGKLPMDLASDQMVADLQSRGILSSAKHLIMQETMGIMYKCHDHSI